MLRILKEPWALELGTPEGRKIILSQRAVLHELAYCNVTTIKKCLKFFNIKILQSYPKTLIKWQQILNFLNALFLIMICGKK